MIIIRENGKQVGAIELKDGKMSVTGRDDVKQIVSGIQAGDPKITDAEAYTFQPFRFWGREMDAFVEGEDVEELEKRFKQVRKRIEDRRGAELDKLLASKGITAESLEPAAVAAAEAPEARGLLGVK